MTVKPAPDDRAGRTRTFRETSEGRTAVTVFGVILVALPGGIAFTPAARQSGLNTWGALALVAFFGAFAAILIASAYRLAVIVRNGKVTIRQLRSRTIDASEIRAVTLQVVRERKAPPKWKPVAELSSGESIKLNALWCGNAGRPPDPDRLALLSEFLMLVGLSPDPQIDASE